MHGDSCNAVNVHGIRIVFVGCFNSIVLLQISIDGMLGMSTLIRSRGGVLFFDEDFPKNHSFVRNARPHVMENTGMWQHTLMCFFVFLSNP